MMSRKWFYCVELDLDKWHGEITEGPVRFLKDLLPIGSGDRNATNYLRHWSGAVEAQF